MMDKFILLTVIQMLSLNEAYNFTCPSQPHWNIRAKSMCNPPRNYTCLLNVTFRVNVYRDICNRPRILGPGYKYVFQPNLNRATCSVNRYQPFIFDTIGYSDCTFQKSRCTSLGQETYENGNTKFDRKCTCNNDRGYSLVMNARKQCYCNPSTEDCSCYLRINPYNKTIRLKDIKCYDDMKTSRGLYKEDQLNTSRTIKIFEFDNYKYNLNYVPTNKYRRKAAILVLILSLANFVCCLLLINWRRLRRSFQCPIILPGAINQLSEGDKIRYNKLMQTSKTEKRFFVRIMIVGKETTGKTCLLRRLLNERISDVSSTDGVDIVVRRCKINITDGKWIIGKEFYDDKVSRIKRALIPNADDGATYNMQVDETKNINIRQRDEMSTKKDTTTDTMVGLDKSEDKNESSLFVKPEDFTTEAEVNMDKNEDTNESLSLLTPKDFTRNAKTNLDNNIEKKRSSSLVMPDDLMSNVFSKSTVNTLSNLFALCELWDFAGQKEFYATHQAFLTSSAVYLIVADMKDDISKQGLSQCFADFQHIGEYVDFWFDSIHCHRTADERSSDGHFDLPIVLVFTGKYKYDKEADFKKREKELNDQIDKVLGFQTKYHHLHYKFYLSNIKDTNEEFEKLRNAISESAQKMDTWGNAFPLKWILLEHLIEIIKNNGRNFINFTDMSKLAKHRDINILEEDELLLFLRFQHNVGKIIFFENIPDLIVLNPQWLSDAFRCLVSDRVDNSRLHHLEDWTLFTRQGKISESLITELFNSKDGSQFSGQKNNLHKVMEKLDILVKIENSSYYIMPSMMPPSTFDIVCEQFGILTEKCIRTSWLCFKFEFLPPSFFNHLSAWFIRNYDSSKVDSGIALYRGICMFDIDRSGGKKIVVAMSSDTIALQVVSFSKQLKEFGSMCSDIYKEVTQLIEDIKERYKVKISFQLHFKCSDGYYFQDTFEYEKLTSEKECFCIQHQEMHRSDQIYLPWTKNEITRIPDISEINSEQNDHNPQNGPNKEEAAVRDQPSVDTNLPVSITRRQQLNIKESRNQNRYIYSCIKIVNALVFIDSIKKRFIICNADGTDIRHILLSYKPWYITEIDSNTVAVSCGYDKTILIINISTISVTSTINTDGNCYGISYSVNNLYVVIEKSIIHVTDLTGNVIRTIHLPSDSTIDITVDRDSFVCIDYKSIHCCSLNGKVIWKFKKDTYQYLRCVTTDGAGNVYVTNYGTDNVVVISHDGQYHRELLNKLGGLDNPSGIYFDKNENILLVCNLSNGKALLFDVKNETILNEHK